MIYFTTHQEASFFHLWTHLTQHFQVDVALQGTQEWHLEAKQKALHEKLEQAVVKGNDVCDGGKNCNCQNVLHSSVQWKRYDKQ